MIWRKDIQDAYQKAIEAREITSSFASSIVMKDELPQVHFMEGYSISEISAPKSFMNKSIRELDIRARYGVEVLSVKTVKNKSEIIKAIPNADYIIRKDDVLVVAGEIRNINILQNVD
jgi:trk system potassium uptake protein TrkA